MIASEAVRKARKDMQLARLAKKAEAVEAEDPTLYSEFYRNQPLQKVRIAAEKERKGAEKNLRVAKEALQVAEITGEGLAAAQEQHAIASIVVRKLEEKDAPGRGASLTAG